jgi:hypothetical protein
MIIKILILILFFIYSTNLMQNTDRIKRNRKDNQHKLELYEKCLNNRAENIKKHQHRQLNECELGTSCKLKSNDCIQNYIPNYESKSKWLKSNQTLKIDSNKHIITSDNDLIILNVDFEDKGFYYLITQNGTIINEVYLNIIDKILRKPIYITDKLFNDNRNKIVKYLNHSFAIKIIWSEWSNCKCDTNNRKSINGYQTRNGNCVLFRDEFSFPCKTLLKNLDDEYYIMFGECTDCFRNSYKTDKKLNKFDKKYAKLDENNEKLRKTLHITNTHLIMTDLSKYVQLDCEIKLKDEFDLEINVTWIINYNDRNFVLNSLTQTSLVDESIFIDDLYNLNIKSINSSSNFICFHDDLKKSIFNVKLNAYIPNNIYNYLTYAGIGAVIITLLLAILLSIGI